MEAARLHHRMPTTVVNCSLGLRLGAADAHDRLRGFPAGRAFPWPANRWALSFGVPPFTSGDAMTAMWVVAAGEPFAIQDAREDARGFRLIGLNGRRLWRDEYGFDWLVVEADSAGEAVAYYFEHGMLDHLAAIKRMSDLETKRKMSERPVQTKDQILAKCVAFRDLRQQRPLFTRLADNASTKFESQLRALPWHKSTLERNGMF